MLSLQKESYKGNLRFGRVYKVLQNSIGKQCRPGRLASVFLLLFLSGGWAFLFGQATTGFTKVNTTAITGTSFTSGTLVDGATYNIEVTAVNSAGESGPSTIVSGAVPSSGTHTFTLTWTASTGATSYNVYDQVVTIPNPPGAPSLTIN